MAWLAVDQDGSEYIYEDKPYRVPIAEIFFGECYNILLPEGSIEKLIGRKLTWENEAVEI